MKSIKKALITAGGYGTRFFPITKSVQKEMLPILNKPILDYLVEDCIKAGITDIVFIVKQGDTLVRNYYTESKTAYEYLQQRNKLEKYDEIKHLHTQASFQFIEQPNVGDYGTAIPVKLAKEQLKNEEAFVVLMGDDFLFNPNGENVVSQMINYFNNSNADALLSCMEVPFDQVNKYGIIDYVTENGFNFLARFVEKPAIGELHSNFANISKYILNSRVFDILETQKPDERLKEFLLTDSIISLASTQKVAVLVPEGEYLDGGSIAGWLKANLTVAKQNPELWNQILATIDSLR